MPFVNRFFSGYKEFSYWKYMMIIKSLPISCSIWIGVMTSILVQWQYTFVSLKLVFLWKWKISALADQINSWQPEVDTEPILKWRKKGLHCAQLRLLLAACVDGHGSSKTRKTSTAIITNRAVRLGRQPYSHYH